jgi:hypothetical protein
MAHTHRAAMKRAAKRFASNEPHNGQDFEVVVDSDGAAAMLDNRPRQYGQYLAYTNGTDAAFVANDRFSESDADLLDALADTLRDAGYYEPQRTEDGWSTWYR